MTRPPRIFADADNPPWPRYLRRVQLDLDFIAWLRTAPHEDLALALPAKVPWRDLALRHRMRRSPALPAPSRLR